MDRDDDDAQTHQYERVISTFTVGFPRARDFIFDISCVAMRRLYVEMFGGE